MSAIAIVDYGMGNMHSVLKKLRRIGGQPRVVSTPAEVAAATRLVLPGVGHFGEAMRNLETSGLRASLDEAVLSRGVPVLGICLGMQLFARRSEEGDSIGLGWIDADAVRFKGVDTARYKVPQMGWNTVAFLRASELTRDLPASPEFYFAHAYHLACRDPGDVVGETEYSYVFPSVVQRKNIFGVQFHPEKSHDLGETMLRNFAAL
jgi:glutamine amidotransferase